MSLAGQQFFSVVETRVRCVQLCSEASLHIKDTQQPYQMSEFWRIWAVLHLSVKQSCDKAFRDKAFQVDRLHTDKSIPSPPDSQQMSSQIKSLFEAQKI